MNFQNLSVEGYASFILGIIFSVLCIASFIYFARHKDLSKAMVVSIGLVLPVVTIFCWTYFFMTIYEYKLAFSLGISFAVALGYAVLALVIVGISYLIIKARQNRKPKETKVQEEPKNIEDNQSQETQEEPVEVPLLALTENQETTETEDTTEVQEPQIEESTEEVTEETNETQEESTNEESQETPEETQQEQSEEPEIAQETPVAMSEEDTNDDFDDEEMEEDSASNEPKKTFEEQLAETDSEIVEYYNEVLAYAESKPKTRRFTAKYQIAVKIGRWRLLLVKFIRGKLACNFMAGSSEIKNYTVQEKNVNIKEKPVIVVIDSAESVAVAKNMIDITFNNIDAANEEKKAQKKAERKAKRDAKKLAENGENQENNEENNEGENE